MKPAADNSDVSLSMDASSVVSYKEHDSSARPVIDDISAFLSFDGDNDSLSDASLTDHAMVREENDFLRNEIRKLRAQLQKKNHYMVEKKKTVSRRGRQRPSKLSCFKSRPTRQRSRSLSPGTSRIEEDVEFIFEPGLPLDIHESAPGLHHRHHNDDWRYSSHKKEQHDEEFKSLMLDDYHSDGNDDNDDSDLEAPPVKGSGDCCEDVEFVESSSPFFAAVCDQAGWLVGLLVLQSLSSFIIKRNADLLTEHAVIVQFLTMLVGAGGNAGNQASVKGVCVCVCMCVRLPVGMGGYCMRLLPRTPPLTTYHSRFFLLPCSYSRLGAW
jgi:hypothetical protein